LRNGRCSALGCGRPIPKFRLPSAYRQKTQGDVRIHKRVFLAPRLKQLPARGLFIRLFCLAEQCGEGAVSASTSARLRTAEGRTLGSAFGLPLRGAFLFPRLGAFVAAGGRNHHRRSERRLSGHAFSFARCDSGHRAPRCVVLDLELQQGRAARSFRDVLSPTGQSWLTSALVGD
jgi:hypothetical protein